jgi:hypothetical protein
VNNSKHAIYNSLIYDMKNKIGKKGKYENYHIAIGDFDHDPDTPDDVILLDELNRLLGYNRYTIELKPKQDIFNKTMCLMFPDPEINSAFRKTKNARILKGWLKLPSAEKLYTKINQKYGQQLIPENIQVHLNQHCSRQ